MLTFGRIIGWYNFVFGVLVLVHLSAAPTHMWTPISIAKITVISIHLSIWQALCFANPLTTYQQKPNRKI